MISAIPPGCGTILCTIPVVSLCSTTGYCLATLRVATTGVRCVQKLTRSRFVIPSSFVIRHSSFAQAAFVALAPRHADTVETFEQGNGDAAVAAERLAQFAGGGRTMGL